ncbi:MAG: hypothetical protein FJ358_02735 [Thaumarchaeota archaeon]|nr:hypothetical protein [Nitrososphaerota archaeon]
MINIKSSTVKDGWVFTIQVQESNGTTEHRVRMNQADYRKLTNNTVSPEECVRKSFEFLLERESKESILREFDIMKIAYYFPEYPKELERRIRK